MKANIGLSIAVLLGIIVFLLNHFIFGLRIDRDSAGVLISALGVMVTALVGWQVYNAVEMKSIFNQVDGLKSDLAKSIQSQNDRTQSLEWLTSALHGSTLKRVDFNSDTEYFLHCLDVIGCYIKSGVPTDNRPFDNSLFDLEAIVERIKTEECVDEIFRMGGQKDYVRAWYDTVLTTIDTKVQHLKNLKTRIHNIYDEYLIITKGVKIKPQKQS